MSLINSGSMIRIYSFFSGNKLNGKASYRCDSIRISVLISFDDDTENVLLSIPMFYKVVSTLFVMTTQNRILLLGFGVTDKPCFETSHRSNITRWCYSQLYISKICSTLTVKATWRRYRQKTKSILVKIPMDRLCRLIGKLSKPIAQNNKKHFCEHFWSWTLLD